LGTESEEGARAMLNDPRPLAAEWLILNEGDRVKVHKDGRILRGTVDCVAADGSIFWIWQDGGAGRTAIHEDPDTSVSVCQQRDTSANTINSKDVAIRFVSSPRKTTRTLEVQN
jgi:hypothetical protein